ncbi:MAG TPA: winged helix-turn-helix transcriptional regulator [Methanocorpusculum sp.]|nr:winged helix-turn-helix transcriptional regulator [Methanocorpusculum sp.]HJK31252.1 winged helix-turn-helix transcriptional regulator [Methanocorpusculum sp.]HJK43799.1 winged helix-turn-helix transcriptional regulator [Methanocorpusculum sp.]
MTTAEETGPRTIGNMYVSPMYEDSVPIDDGKVIHVLSGLDYLQFWRHKIVSELSGFFSHTVLYETFIFLSPLIFALLGFICLLLCTADRRKKPSSLQENILLCIRENPGITQKQITDTVRCSRGSVCYHLHQLEKTGKIRKLNFGTAPQYYPSAELPSPDTLIEQTILLLLSRKKSGRFLRTLYEHPGITQKELAALLNIRPTTVHWYLHTYTKSRILSIEQNGRELRYSLTREAETICARLIPDTQNP